MDGQWTRRGVLATLGMACWGAGRGRGEEPLTEVASRPFLVPEPPPLKLQSLVPGAGPAVVTALAVDPRQQQIAIGCDDGSIRLIRPESFEPLGVLDRHRDLVRTLDFCSEGDRLVSAGNDGQLLIWSTAGSGAAPRRIPVDLAISHVRFAPGGEEITAVGFAHDTVRIPLGAAAEPVPGAESPRAAILPPIRCRCRDLRVFAYHGDGKLLVVGGRSGAVELFDADDGTSRGVERLHDGRLRDLAFLGDRPVLASCGEDGVVAVFDTDRLEKLRTVRVTTGRLFALAPVDGTRVAVGGSDNVIRLVDLESGAVVRELSGHEGSVSALAVCGRWLFSGGYDATLRRWPLRGLSEFEGRIAEGDQRIER